MAAPIFDQVTRRQVLLERYKADELRRLDAFLREMDRALRERLGRATTTDFQRGRIERLLADIELTMEAVQAPYQRDLFGRMEALGVHEAATEARMLTGGSFEAAVPSPEQVRAAVLSSPLSARGAGGGMLLQPFVADWAQADKERVVGAIRRGAFEGKTTEQIIRDIRGTRALGFTDGVIAVNRNAASTVVRTAVQHVASTARMETLKANSDILKGYRWSSTLDGKTSSVCRSLDGQVFEFGKGPVPPAHPNCRSSIVPELIEEFAGLTRGAKRASEDGPVDASLSYYEWLKQQPRSFVEDAIGPTRAALFLEGGIDAEEFARLQLGRNFQPLTLDQLRRLMPHVFERAGV